MKKLLYMAVAAIAALSSCSNDNDIVSNENGNVANAPVFTAAIEGDATSRTTIGTGSAGKKKVNWEDTDEVSINGAVYSVAPGSTDATTATLTLKTGDAPSAPYKACYPASMYNGGTITLPASYTYVEGKFNMPMYAESENTSLAFKNICGVLAIKVTSAEMAKVTKITVTSDKAISGACTITGNAATATGTADANKTVTLDCGEGVTPSGEGTTFYLPVPEISGAQLYISVAGTINSTKAASYAPFLYRQAMNASNVTIERNNIYNIDFKTSLAKFTVKAAAGSNPAKTVNFTKANLYWNGSAFMFETNQTDYPTTYSANHVGHLKWCNNVPDMYSWDNNHSQSGTFFFDETNKNNEANKVEGTSGLFVLSSAEWSYLLGISSDKRTNATNLRKYGVTVSNNGSNYSNCLIIAPDGFIGTLQSSYSLADVNTLGFVCLPCAQKRWNTSSSPEGGNGEYWSSTPNTSNTGLANAMKFNSSSVELIYGGRSWGRTLRLVK